MHRADIEPGARRRHLIDTTAAPLVSLIMSIHNSAATIEPTIRSILWQTHANWELIVIDDGSRDDGAARVAKFGDPRIRIVRHDTSQPLGYRLNEAVGLARGEYIARMDADDICYPQRLAAQVGVLRSEPTIDLLASKAVVFRGQGEIVGLMPAPKTHDEVVAHPYRGFMFLHPSWCGKAAWFRKHQYDELLRSAEDQELLLRAASSSRFASIDEILLGYRKESLGLSKSCRTHRLFARGMAAGTAIRRLCSRGGRYRAAFRQVRHGGRRDRRRGRTMAAAAEVPSVAICGRDRAMAQNMERSFQPAEKLAAGFMPCEWALKGRR